MPRNGSGNYTLPQSAFVPNTPISSAAVNSDFSDIAAQITNSLAADGQTTMTGQIKAQTGSAAAPGYSFAADLNSGFFSAGADTIGVAVGGVQVATFTSAGVSNGIPIGTILDYAGPTDAGPPTGWLACYGQSLAAASYPGLFAVIGYNYGGSGPNFSLPDCRGCVTAGRDNMGGVAAGRLTTTYFGADPTVKGVIGGSESNTLDTTTLPAHTHGFSATTSTDGAHTHTYIGNGTLTLNSGGGFAAIDTTRTTSSNGAHTHTVSGTSASSGTGSPHANVQPTIIFNKIIYTGV